MLKESDIGFKLSIFLRKRHLANLCLEFDAFDYSNYPMSILHYDFFHFLSCLIFL